jgi:hypothetical protein
MKKIFVAILKTYACFFLVLCSVLYPLLIALVGKVAPVAGMEKLYK